MSGRGRNSRRRGRGRGRGQSRRRIVRMARSLHHVEVMGGTLPRRQPLHPPSRTLGDCTTSFRTRHVTWISLAPDTGDKSNVSDNWISVGKDAWNTITDPVAQLANIYVYYRLRYADVWFYPLHGTNTCGIYAMHLVSAEMQHTGFNPTDPSSFDRAASMPNSCIRKAYQPAALRFHFMSERSAAFRVMPAAGSDGDDLFHVLITVPGEGIIDPSGPTGTKGSKALRGRIVVDAHWTMQSFSGRDLTPTPKVCAPYVTDRSVIIDGIGHHIHPGTFDSICRSILAHHNDETFDSWYQAMFQRLDLTASTGGATVLALQGIRHAMGTAAETAETAFSRLMRALNKIYQKIPSGQGAVPPNHEPNASTSKTDEETTPPGSPFEME